MNRTIILLALTVLAAAAGLAQPPDTAATSVVSAPLPPLEAGPARPQQQGPVQEVHINPSKDTYVFQGEKEPVGTMHSLKIGADNGTAFHTLIRFEFPERMGTASQIQSARLRLYCEFTEKFDPGNRTFEVREANHDRWDEEKTNWDNSPNPVGGNIVWILEECDTEWVESPDLTTLVTKWYTQPDSNNGLLIKPRAIEKNTLISFASRESSSKWPVGVQPDLFVQAILPDTPTPTETPSPTATITPTPSDTPTPSNTPTASDTPTITDTPVATDTPTPTMTPTPALAFLPWADTKRLPTPVPPTDTPEGETPIAPTGTPGAETPLAPTDTPGAETPLAPTATPEGGFWARLIGRWR